MDYPTLTRRADLIKDGLGDGASIVIPALFTQMSRRPGPPGSPGRRPRQPTGVPLASPWHDLSRILCSWPVLRGSGTAAALSGCAPTHMLGIEACPAW